MLARRVSSTAASLESVGAFTRPGLVHALPTPLTPLPANTTTTQKNIKILLRMKAMGPLQPFDMRVELCQVHLKGRLRFGLQLGREPPGIT